MTNMLLLTTACFALAIVSFFIIVYVGGIIASHVIKLPKYSGTGKSGLRGRISSLPVTIAIYVFVIVFAGSLFVLHS